MGHRTNHVMVYGTSHGKERVTKDTMDTETLAGRDIHRCNCMPGHKRIDVNGQITAGDGQRAIRGRSGDSKGMAGSETEGYLIK